MEIAALAVVILGLIFHFLLSVIVSERYTEHSGISAQWRKVIAVHVANPHSIVPNRSE